MRILHLLILLLLTASAGGLAQSGFKSYKIPSKVEHALLLAGENRAQLESVLSYYSKRKKDSLHFRAACFLIENMQWHNTQITHIDVDANFLKLVRKADLMYYKLVKGKSSAEIESPLIDTLVRRMGRTMRDYIKTLKLREPEITLNTEGFSDLKTVQAKFLIDQIDHAFRIRASSPLVQMLSFGDFCEHTLPYRVMDVGLLRYSGKQFNLFFKKYLGNPDINRIPEIIRRYNLTLRNMRLILGNYVFQSNVGFEELFFKGPPNFDCFNVANYGFAALNACGVPVNTEFNIAYAIFLNKHADMNIPLALGDWTPFTLEESIPRRKVSKAEEYEEHKERKRLNFYRFYFAAQKGIPFFLKNDGEYIPAELNQPCISDATDLNLRTVSLKLPFSKKTDNKFAYLASFNSALEMVPVAWGLINKINNSVSFEKVIPNILYFPVFYNDYGLETFSPPLYLKQDSSIDEGYLKEYINEQSPPDSTVDIILTRKFPRKPNMIRLAEGLIGAHVVGYDSTGGKIDTLAVLRYAPPPYLQDIALNNTRAYKYYQVRPAIEKTKLKMSEIYFLTDEKYKYTNVCEPLALPVLYPGQKPAGNSFLVRVLHDTLNKLSRHLEYDGSMETVSRDSIVTMQLKEPQVVTTIRFAPQNANNGIVSGNEYLLKYWDKGAWIDFEYLKTVDYNYLEFKGVPKGRLYWLKNLSKGKEELPFTIDSLGRQQFLYFDMN